MTERVKFLTEKVRMNDKCHVELITKIPTVEEQRKTKAALLEVWGLGCTNCAARVRNSPIQRKGVLDAYVDHIRGEAKVVFNPDLVTVADLLEAVKRAGDDGRHEYWAVLEELKSIP